MFSEAHPSSRPRPVLFSLTSHLLSQELWGLERGQRYVAGCESKENCKVSPKALCPVLASLPTHKDGTFPREPPPSPNPQGRSSSICPPPFSRARQLQVQ